MKRVWDWEVVSYPSPAPHKCRLPRRKDRKLRGVTTGTIISCKECGRKWEYRGFTMWTRLPDAVEVP